MERDEILTFKEVCAELRTPENTMRWYRVRGEGPYFWKLGGRLVAYRKDVDKWVRDQYEAGTKVGA